MADTKTPPVPEEPPFEMFVEIPELPLSHDMSVPPLAPPPGWDETVSMMGGKVEEVKDMIEPLARSSFGEAPVSFHTTMFRKDKRGDFHWVTMTVRGEDPIITFDHFCALANEVENRGWVAKPDTQYVAAATGVSGAPSTPQAPNSNQPTPPQSNAGASAAPSAGRSDNGTDVLHKLIVVPTPKGIKVEFYVGRFNYPMSDSRSSEVIAKLFDPALGWTPAHLETPHTYDLSQHNYEADWEKITKEGTKGKPATYYNVLRIHSKGVTPTP